MLAQFFFYPLHDIKRSHIFSILFLICLWTENKTGQCYNAFRKSSVNQTQKHVYVEYNLFFSFSCVPHLLRSIWAKQIKCKIAKEMTKICFVYGKLLARHTRI